MNQASVGFHCPECTRSSGQKIVRPNQLISRPIVTQVLIALNVAVFVYGLGGGGLSTSQDMTIDGGLIARGWTGTELVGVAEGEWWRPVSSGLLHATLIHICFTCLVPSQLGTVPGHALGRPPLGAVYFARSE